MTANTIIILLTLMGITGIIEFRPWRGQYRNTTYKVIFWIYWSVLVVVTISIPTMWLFIL